ncbi:hypothetical protein LK540_11255 [Massilia sp. IC2-278]|uniref:hypothetical protein n=1 Tax=Massilia sp. IC2-278 TaxID=2887200 RepID=UPI001E326639|nr:hypothetical protein [Massilia sp. IC2-278]MCC2961000.1 hypothetical protein [Massilia sp. IC2-278]
MVRSSFCCVDDADTFGCTVEYVGCPYCLLLCCIALCVLRWSSLCVAKMKTKNGKNTVVKSNFSMIVFGVVAGHGLLPVKRL